MSQVNAAQLGLDIGSQHLTAVRLTCIDDVVETVSVARCGLPAGAIGERGQLVEPSRLTGALKLLHRDGHLKARNTICALPAGLLTVQPMTKPAALSPKETESSIGLEMAPALSYSLSELRLAWEVTGRDHDTEQVHLVAYACRAQDADVRAKAIGSARLKLADITPEPLALVEAIQLDESPEVREVVLHIGLHQSLLMLVGEGKVLYCQSVPLGGAQMTDQVSQASGLSLPEAEQFKRRHSLIGPKSDDPHARPRSGMQAAVENFVDAIYQVLSYDSGAEQVQRLLLSGSSALMSGMPSYFNQLLELPVDRVQPRADLRVADTELFAADALAYGLAMRGIRK